MSKMRPTFACSSSALPMSFSLPAKCSHAAMTGNAFYPAKSASLGCGARRSVWLTVAMETPEGNRIF